MGYAEMKWIGFAALSLGSAVLYVAVRKAGWYKRVAPWFGVVAATLVLVVGGVLAYVGSTERPLIAQADQPTREELSRPVTSFEFPLVTQDHERSLRDFRGQVVLLNLWATWCAPCLKELPALNRLQEEYRQEGLVVITLSPEPRDEIAEFAAGNPFATVNGYIPDKEALPDPFRRAFLTMPTSYVIDRDGYIVEFVLGSRSFDQWEEKVVKVLKGDES